MHFNFKSSPGWEGNAEARERDLFLFPYGAVVFWGFDAAEELGFVNLLEPCAACGVCLCVVVWWCGGVVVWWCGGVVVWWCCGGGGGGGGGGGSRALGRASGRRAAR